LDLQLARWGNSLALRIPSEVVRSLGLREGSTVEARLTVDGTLSIRPAKWDRGIGNSNGLGLVASWAS
jgi:antitoxin MazE